MTPGASAQGSRGAQPSLPSPAGSHHQQEVRMGLCILPVNTDLIPWGISWAKNAPLNTHTHTHTHTHTYTHVHSFLPGTGNFLSSAVQVYIEGGVGAGILSLKITPLSTIPFCLHSRQPFLAALGGSRIRSGLTLVSQGP